MYDDAIRGEVSQGDIFQAVRCVQGDTTQIRMAMLLTHDCTYDKPQVEFVLVAWVRPLTAVNPQSHGGLRAGKVVSALHLPAKASELEESFVDLNHITSVRKSDLAKLAAAGGRLVSLTEDGRLALRHQLHVFFARTQQAPLTTPSP